MIFFKFVYFTASIEACKKNIKFNDVAASSKVEAYLTDARVYMLTHPKEFDVVISNTIYNIFMCFLLFSS